MFRSILLFTACSLMAYASAAPAANPPAAATATRPADVIAQSGGGSLSSADIQGLLASLSPAERAKLSGSLTGLEQLARSELLRRSMLTAAKSAGFDRQADTQSQLDALRDVMLVRLWLASKAAVPSGYPSEADISAAYDSNRQALAAPTQYHLAQIYIKAPDGADPAKLLVALKKVSEISAKLTPADFSRMAQDFSEHTESATKGGDLGYLQENRMIPQIAAAVRTMKSGDVVGPIKTPEGLHFLKLLDKKDGAVPALADVHDELASALRSRRASELEQAYIKDQTTESSITINQIALANLQQTLK